MCCWLCRHVSGWPAILQAVLEGFLQPSVFLVLPVIWAVCDNHLQPTQRLALRTDGPRLV